MSLRLVAPCYEGEMVLVRCDGSTVSAEREDGSLYASGGVDMDAGARPVAASLGFRPLPQTYDGPTASPQTILPAQVSSLRQPLDVTTETHSAEGLLPRAHWSIAR